MGRGRHQYENIPRIEDVPKLPPDKIPTSFVDNLDEVRDFILKEVARRGLNQSDLARAIGRSRQYVNMILVDNVPFGVETMKRMAVALRMDLCVEFRKPTKKEKR